MSEPVIQELRMSIDWDDKTKVSEGLRLAVYENLKTDVLARSMT